jgi:hypothetical protein
MIKQPMLMLMLMLSNTIQEKPTSHSQTPLSTISHPNPQTPNTINKGQTTISAARTRHILMVHPK